MSAVHKPTLLIGATGALGAPVSEALLTAGVPLRLLHRQPSRLAALAARGAEVVQGDLIDTASLQAACSGAERVFVAAHAITGRGRWRSEAVDDAGHRALIAAARSAGVRRFVYVSAFGASPNHPVDFFRTKYRIEQVLRDSGLDAVILRPTAFMEQHVHLFNGAAVLAKGKAQLIGPATKPRNFVRAADLAPLVVRALLEDPPPFRELDIGGHDHASNAEVAALYAREAGLPPKASHLPLGIARTLATLARPFHPGAARILTLLTLPDDAVSERFDGAAQLEQRFGVRFTRLEEFVRERVAAGRGGRA